MKQGFYDSSSQPYISRNQNYKKKSREIWSFEFSNQVITHEALKLIRNATRLKLTLQNKKKNWNEIAFLEDYVMENESLLYKSLLNSKCQCAMSCHILRFSHRSTWSVDFHLKIWFTYFYTRFACKIKISRQNCVENSLPLKKFL